MKRPQIFVLATFLLILMASVLAGLSFGGRVTTVIATKSTVIDSEWKMEMVKRGGLTLMTMPLPDARMGMGTGVTLRRLPGGCVVSGLHPETDDYAVVIWPSGTTIDAAGRIVTNFWPQPEIEMFRVGQKLTGGMLMDVPVRKLHLTKAARQACPGKHFLQVDGLSPIRK